MQGEEKRIDCPFSAAFVTYQPMEACKGVVIICPGGGYEWLSARESLPVAAAFAKKGYQGVILYYSVADVPLGTLPLRELAWAVRAARDIAAWRGKPLFVCGFSAGAHLAASLGVHGQDEALFTMREEREAQRPDGLILSYPVISAGIYAHRGSIARLTGGDAALNAYFSLENHVTAQTPPAFLWHTADDESVPVQNSLLFYEALLRAGVKSELHIFPTGAHGLSLATIEVQQPEKRRLADPHVAAWFDLCAAWMQCQSARR
ncbi:MAG: alpha/beta hydrolase [Clostridia bacterium]|nr:alpha/beta hydrolase [Clostridia bacterium]